MCIDAALVLRSGENVELDSELPAPAGNSVIHYANTVHHDDAKGQETIIQVRGMAPATSAPAGRR